MNFSPPYTVVHHAIFVRRDAPAIETEEDLRGDIMHDYVLENGLSDNPIITGGDSSEPQKGSCC